MRTIGYASQLVAVLLGNKIGTLHIDDIIIFLIDINLYQPPFLQKRRILALHPLSGAGPEGVMKGCGCMLIRCRSLHLSLNVKDDENQVHANVTHHCV